MFLMPPYSYDVNYLDVNGVNYVQDLSSLLLFLGYNMIKSKFNLGSVGKFCF